MFADVYRAGLTGDWLGAWPVPFPGATHTAVDYTGIRLNVNGKIRSRDHFSDNPNNALGVRHFVDGLRGWVEP